MKWVFAFVAAGPLVLHAADTWVTRSETVRFADLNLQSEAGIAMLHQRIEAAAARACSPLQDQPGRYGEYRHCRESAVQEAIGRVSIAALTAYHMALHGSKPVKETPIRASVATME